MIDMGSIQAAGASIKAAADIATGLLKLKISSEVQSKVIELQREILTAQASAMSAQADQFTLVQRVRDLEKEIAQLKTWETEKQRYELTQLAPGTVAYLVKEGARGSEPVHCICAHCYEDGKKSILHIMKDYLGTAHITCPRCKTELTCWGEREDFPLALS